LPGPAKLFQVVSVKMNCFEKLFWCVFGACLAAAAAAAAASVL